MDIKQANQYFTDCDEVVLWWRPEKDIMAPIYQRSLDLTVKQLRQYPSIVSVLDAACGKGRATKTLAQFYRVTAADISEVMLKYIHELRLPNVRIVRSDIAKTSFLDNEFDAIICLEALVHLSDLKQLFREFYRILKPDGILIIDFDNKYGLTRLIKNLFHFFFKMVDYKYRVERRKKEHIFRTLSRTEVIRILREAGFKIKEKFYIGVITPFAIKNKLIVSPKFFRYISWLNRILEKTPFIKNFSTYIYIVCQK